MHMCAFKGYFGVKGENCVSVAKYTSVSLRWKLYNFVSHESCFMKVKVALESRVSSFHHTSSLDSKL